MDNALKELLERRIANKQCIICGKNCGKTNTPVVLLEHAELGIVEICQSHIRVQKD